MNDLPVCIFCGVLTDDWWLLDGKTNTCRCHDCYACDIAETEHEKAFYASFPPAPKAADTLPSPSVKPDLSIWKEYFTKGGRERLQRWVDENAKKKGYQ